MIAGSKCTVEVLYVLGDLCCVLCTCVHASVSTCVCVRACVRVCVRVRVRACVRPCVHTCVHTYVCAVQVLCVHYVFGVTNAVYVCVLRFVESGDRAQLGWC